MCVCVCNGAGFVCLGVYVRTGGWGGGDGQYVCLCVCWEALDCFSCCSGLICEIELCLHTAAPAAWHCACVCVCV